MIEGVNSVERRYAQITWAASSLRLHRVLTIFPAVIYGGVLSQIPARNFKDFENYLIYAEHSWQRLTLLLDQGLLATLVNEPVWLLINAAFAAFLMPDAVVRWLIFLSATTVAWLVLTRNPRQFVWLLMFLLLPSVLKNHVIHLRQGTAIAVFLAGWFAPSPVIRWILLGSAPFIHASFAFVLPVFWMARSMVGLRLGADIRALSVVGIGVAVGLLMGWLAVFVGARQGAEYDFSMAEVSGLGFVFWLAILLLAFLQGRQFLRVHAFETGMIIFYLSTYWLVEVTARIFESALVLVLIAGLSLTAWRRQAFLLVVLIYGCLAWTLRIGQPALGFGIG